MWETSTRASGNEADQFGYLFNSHSGNLSQFMNNKGWVLQTFSLVKTYNVIFLTVYIVWSIKYICRGIV